MSEDNIKEYVDELFPFYLGGGKFCKEVNIISKKGINFCNICGKANSNKQEFILNSQTLSVGTQDGVCECLNLIMEKLNEQHYLQRVLGLKPGWIVLK